MQGSRLLSARQASILLADMHVSEATAKRKAAKAFAAGDLGIMRIAGGWLASEDWWRAQFAQKPKTGRPRKKKLDSP